MKYRKVTDLTDEEIKEVFKVVFDVDNTEIISRNKKEDTIICGFDAVWGEDILIQDTFEISCYGIEDIGNDYPLSDEDNHLFQKFLIAKGCHFLQKDNSF